MSEIKEELADPQRAKATLNSLSALERAAMTMQMVRQAEKFADQERSRYSRAVDDMLETSPVRHQLRAKVEAWRKEGKDIRTIYMLARRYVDERASERPASLKRPAFQRAPEGGGAGFKKAPGG